MITIAQKFTTRNRCYTNASPITVKGIVLHSTGTNQPLASKYFDSYNSGSISKAVHAFLQADGYVMQTLPWTYKAWHCGGSYNNDHIGIEICEPSTIKYTGGAQWIDNNPEVTMKHMLAAYKVAVELFGNLCIMFNLNPLADGVIVSHHEAHMRGKASGHSDVEHIWNKLGLSMQQFRIDVSSYMRTSIVPTPAIHTSTGASVATTVPAKQNTTTVAKPSSSAMAKGTLYQVNISDKNSVLNIRDLPNGSQIVGTLSYNYIVNVVDIKNNWAQLSTGGWVSLNFLKKFNNGFTYSPKRYIALIKVDNLNIRSTPEVKVGNVTGTVNKGKKYTIVGICNGYGLLLSGAGNISLDPDYVTLKEE